MPLTENDAEPLQANPVGVPLPQTQGVPLFFLSEAHPGAQTWQWTTARRLVRPLTVCMLPIMIGALINVLQGFPALLYLTIGFPIAVLTAALWTFYRMHATVAEIRVQPGAAAVRTIWECLHNRPIRWVPIFELRSSSATLTVALGDASYELDRSAWSEADALLEALHAARVADAPRLPRS